MTIIKQIKSQCFDWPGVRLYCSVFKSLQPISPMFSVTPHVSRTRQLKLEYLRLIVRRKLATYPGDKREQIKVGFGRSEWARSIDMALVGAVWNLKDKWKCNAALIPCLAIQERPLQPLISLFVENFLTILV